MESLIDTEQAYIDQYFPGDLALTSEEVLQSAPIPAPEEDEPAIDTTPTNKSIQESRVPDIVRSLANCRDEDPNLFVPEQGESTAPAKMICQSCIVIEECLEYALSTRGIKGVWGGTSEKQRVKIRKQRKLLETGQS